MIRNLVSKGFIVEDGKSDLPGKPNLYKTTNYFLDYFNLSSIDELPKIDMDDIEVLEDDDLFNTRYKEEITKIKGGKDSKDKIAMTIQNMEAKNKKELVANIFVSMKTQQ